MKDPFGRLTLKQQKEYASLRQSLRDSKIGSRAQALALLANIRNRALVFGALILIVLALAILALPELKILLIGIAALCVIWLLAITAKGYQLIGRYIREELKDES